MVKILSFLLFVSFVLINESNSESISIDGIWTGEVFQTDTHSVFDTTVIIYSRISLYRIDYGKNGNPNYCGGSWRQINETTFQETITYGPCVSGFTDFIPQTNGTAFYRWRQNQSILASGWFSHRANLCL